ncbi:pickpocket protein 28-like [Armigeres subalbatus]|uniref:pickpocket protein 28-like n=1 Tax=Armigeres subalbatus TaxID=124917 RepID=UPI002ED3D750
MYEKWNSNPVTIAYDSQMPISTIPLPAVTVCPLIKSRVEVFNLTWAMEMFVQNLTMDTNSKRKLRALAHVCPFVEYWKTFSYSKKETVVPDLRKMSHTLQDVIVYCKWRFSVVPCKDMMVEQLLDDGICYTFNSLSSGEIYRADKISLDFLNMSNTTPSSDWTREEGYPSDTGFNGYPFRPLSNGLYSAFIFMATTRDIDRDPMCMTAYTGYKIAVHSPDEVARMKDSFFRIESLSVVTLTITPTVYKASPILRKYSPEKRNCYFSNERHLKFFRIYNKVNCETECNANYTLALCGCVKFSMPRSPGTKICDASKIACYSQTTIYRPGVEPTNFNHKKILNCNCLPSCNSIKYQVEMSRAPLSSKRYPWKLDFLEDE